MPPHRLPIRLEPPKQPRSGFRAQLEGRRDACPPAHAGGSLEGPCAASVSRSSSWFPPAWASIRASVHRVSACPTPSTEWPPTEWPASPLGLVGAGPRSTTPPGWSASNSTRSAPHGVGRGFSARRVFPMGAIERSLFGLALLTPRGLGWRPNTIRIAIAATGNRSLAIASRSGAGARRTGVPAGRTGAEAGRAGARAGRTRAMLGRTGTGGARSGAPHIRRGAGGGRTAAVRIRDAPHANLRFDREGLCGPSLRLGSKSSYDATDVLAASHDSAASVARSMSIDAPSSSWRSQMARASLARPSYASVICAPRL